MSTEKKAYRTTDLAGYFVAGVRISSARDTDGNRVAKVGHVLHLTEAEAKYELLSGVIEPADAPAQAAPLSPPAKTIKAASKPLEAQG